MPQHAHSRVHIARHWAHSLLFVAGIVIAIVTVILFINALQAEREVRAIQARGVTGIAVATRVSPLTTRSISGKYYERNYGVDFLFKAPDGHSYPYFLLSMVKWNPGAPMKIVYDPQNPSGYLPIERVDDITQTYPSIVLAKGILVFGIILLLAFGSVYLVKLTDPNEKRDNTQ